MTFLRHVTVYCCCFLPYYVGSRGNYFKFDRCNFTGNKGIGSRDEFGAAIGVALFTIFEQRVTAVRHDVIDW